MKMIQHLESILNSKLEVWSGMIGYRNVLEKINVQARYFYLITSYYS
ncbi:hypothetical protein B0P06_005888 [Clostridium saccharoperbutylacetonicum]|nr:hypothetical protein [Clostridium saccharoperbutylacetonicum]